MDPQDRKKMFDQAVAAYGAIRPCAGRSWPDCFTVQGDLVIFWFNDEGGNTHAIVRSGALLPAAS